MERCTSHCWMETREKMTVLGHLVAKIREAATYNRHDLAAPSVVLWTDADKAWLRVIGVVGDAMPELLILGEENGERIGPAPSLRYQLGRWSLRETPIVYLPGIGRGDFRSATGFLESARHLFPLQHQGQFWTQASGRDWTPFAFLTSLDAGLTLEVARDNPTKEALLDQLDHILRSPVADLRGRRLEAADFHALVTSDPIRSLLRWMSNPTATQKELKEAEWRSFASICKTQFGIDPEKDGALVAAERLVEGSSAHWNDVWQRYSEAPSTYAGIRDLLSRVKPANLFSAASERLPEMNSEKEDQLRTELNKLEDVSFESALARLSALCHEHAPRMKWVWAKLEEAPLACSAFHLAVMAERIKGGVAGNDWDGLAKAYADTGWLVDGSAWRAMNCVRSAEDSTAIKTALQVVYKPWLEQLAERVQGYVHSYPMTEAPQAWSLVPEKGSIVMFVDGLRFDIGKELCLLLERNSLDFELEPRWTALPTVTATAKPSWDPLTKGLNGNAVSEGFEPTSNATGKPLKAAEFRTRLEELGWRWIDPSNVGDPEHAGWTEAGAFDRYGHDDGARLAWRLEEEVALLSQRVKELFKNGWKSIKIITDHGWLLMPGGLSKAQIPLHLTVSRWGRCAFPKPGAVHEFKETPWFWANEHTVVLAPGASAFKSGTEYTHGGLTVQEALTPVITVKPGTKQGKTVNIASVKWIGLRLKVQLAGDHQGVTVDVRTKAADANSSLLSGQDYGKNPDSSGSVSLVIEQDDRIGDAALIVVIDQSQVVAKQPVTIGGE
jgi:hypothetical protein